jgi:hypothetical protein
MHTRLLMILSAFFMGGLGLGASFLSHEILAVLGLPSSSALVVVVQIAGALYLGFAFMNWMARGILIGGIYSRPLALGNFLQFGIIAITLVKAVSLSDPLPLVVGTAIYAMFTTWFGMVLFMSPVGKDQA